MDADRRKRNVKPIRFRLVPTYTLRMCVPRSYQLPVGSVKPIGPTPIKLIKLIQIDKATSGLELPWVEGHKKKANVPKLCP